MFCRATIVMRAVVLFVSIVVLIFSIALFPEISREAYLIAETAASRISPLMAFADTLLLVGLYAAVIPFLIAIFQVMKLLDYIDKKKAFSERSVKVLVNIKYCALTVCAMYIAGAMPIIFCIAEIEDAPGLILIGLIIGSLPIVVAVFSAILQKLLQEAIDMKSENDLTI